MSLTIGNKKVYVVKGKHNKGLTIVDDYENQTTTVILVKQPFPNAKTDLNIDKIFSDRPQQFNNYTIHAQGNTHNVLIRVVNLSTHKTYFFNHRDMLSSYYLGTDLPQFVKKILFRISEKLIKLPKNESMAILLQAQVMKLKSSLVLAVPCRRNKSYVSIKSCSSCEQFVKYLNEGKVSSVMCKIA